MILTPHMIVGGIIGDLVDNIPLALLIGIISHFLFDAIPHFESTELKFFGSRKRGEQPNKKEIIFEIFEISLGLIIMFFFWKSKSYNLAIAAGIFGAILPDLIDNVPFWSWKLRKYPFFKQVHQFHNFIHFNLNAKYWYLGIPVYIIIAILFIKFW